MRGNVKIWILLIALTFLLTGCAPLSLDQLYHPPKRSEEYDNLQSVIDEAMRDLTYSAPISGENRQAVQTADLDGDGVDEYLLFAKDESENPLKILIFSQVASGYVLMDTIEGYGFAFDFVDFAQTDDRPGVEIIVGRQVSEEVSRSVSVYRFTSDLARLLLSTAYSSISVCDLDENGMHELLIFNSGTSDFSNGMAICYAYNAGELQRTYVSHLSDRVKYLRQVSIGALEDGTPAVFAICAADDSKLTVDVFTILDHSLVNLSDGVSVPAIQDSLVYPTDVDGDGFMELPAAIPLPTVFADAEMEYLISWYRVGKDGRHHDIALTYHHFADGWYLFLDSALAQNLAVEQTEDSCIFYIRDPQSGELIKLMTIHAFTGSDREELAKEDGRIKLYKSDSIIYAADLGEQAESYGITAKDLLKNFQPIRQEWNTEESGD